jgi:hypothetical protein
MGLEGQVVTGVFDGDPNEIQIIVYWPKSVDETNDGESELENPAVPNAISYTLKFFSERSKNPKRTSLLGFKDFIKNALAQSPSDSRSIDGKILKDLELFLSSVAAVSPIEIEPQVIINIGKISTSATEPGKSDAYYVDAICEILNKQKIAGQIVSNLFEVQDNVIEITFYWGAPND